MSQFKCANCQTNMVRTKHPDVEIDTCPSCGGVFLEKGDLNIMATGLGGDIEYCSIMESKIRSDRFPSRLCPKCDNQTMKKVNLLAFSDLIFDYCEHCESFFLDKGEIVSMNEELKEITPHGVAQEYRGYRDAFLVRVDRREGATMAGFGLAGMATKPIGATSIRISVYFAEPLATDLRVFQEKWHAKLAKTFGLLSAHDISTGDAEFDKLFRVEGDDENTIVNTLTPDFREAAIRFVADQPPMYSRPGRLELSRYLISYSEGPYAAGDMPYLTKKAEPIVERLLNLAQQLQK